MQKFYKKYAPNPLLERSDYLFLCGEWDFAFADEVPDQPAYSRKIMVPYTYECQASGVGDATPHSCVWYRRALPIRRHDGSILLHFEGVDYHSFIYLNKTLVCEHVGGFTKFCVDITAFAREGENELEVKVLDSLDKAQLRGKQRAKTQSYDCWYVQTTGIWKPVWLEYAGKTYVTDIRCSAFADGEVMLAAELSGEEKLFVEVSYEGEVVFRTETEQKAARHELTFSLAAPRLWSHDSPALYSLYLRVGAEQIDEVRSYFGISQITAREDGLYVNGRREYQQMILDQGYWEDTMLSAPDDEALEKDIDLIKAMGFNGIRLHQKVENEVFYYLCDKKGMYVWGEIPSCYEFSPRMQQEFSRDSELIFDQLRKHVSIVCWLLFNETWGVYGIQDDPVQQEFVRGIEQRVREKDRRPVITNDGWSHLDSDILSLHEYEQDPAVFASEYEDKQRLVTTKRVNTNRYGPAFASGYQYENQPVFISEYGGIAICGGCGWGYGESAADTSKFKGRLQQLVGVVKGLPYVSGSCYTQFVDTQQETNGLLYADRTPKLPLGDYQEIFQLTKGVKA